MVEYLDAAKDTQVHSYFKDVWFYPVLNFGLFWAALLKMSVFQPTRNFGQFWAPARSPFDLPKC